jgi:hypothetical protein
LSYRGRSERPQLLPEAQLRSSPAQYSRQAWLREHELEGIEPPTELLHDGHAEHTGQAPVEDLGLSQQFAVPIFVGFRHS